jgi:3-hydroxy-9,10-secoandrosta-1,3,5(10)-triene-9,17-dione monooxygenase
MTLGAASPAIGWLAAALNTGFMVASFSRRAQEDVWSGSPQALVATSLSPTREVVAVDGGFRISGTWKFTSGIDHAAWVVLGGLFLGEGPEFRFFLVPRNDFRIVDDWHAMGLRGTGSATAVVESAFVPEHRTLLASHLRDGTTPGARLHANPLYRAPFGLTFPLTLAAAVVGAAKGGLRDWQEAIKARRQAGVFSASRYLPNQLRVSESACEVEAAEMLVKRSMREAMKILRRSRAVGDERRARSYRDAGYAVKLCQRAMDRLLEAAGGSALYTGNGIERAFRDVHAAAAHASLRWDEAAERWGRAALGIAGSNRFF